MHMMKMLMGMEALICSDMQVSESYLNYSPETVQKFSASFLLVLKEKFKLTQVTLQGVIQGVTALNCQNINSLK